MANCKNINSVTICWQAAPSPNFPLGNIERNEHYHNLGQLSSRIHERTISLRFLGIILRVLRLEVSVYHVYITNQFQTTFARRGGGGICL